MIACRTHPDLYPTAPTTVDTTDRLGHRSRPTPCWTARGRGRHIEPAVAPLGCRHVEGPGLEWYPVPGLRFICGPKHNGSLPPRTAYTQATACCDAETPGDTPVYLEGALDPNILTGVTGPRSQAELTTTAAADSSSQQDSFWKAPQREPFPRHSAPFFPEGAAQRGLTATLLCTKEGSLLIPNYISHAVLAVNDCARRRACVPAGRLRSLTAALRHGCEISGKPPEAHPGSAMTTLYIRDGDKFREATTEEILSYHDSTHPLHLRHLLVGTHQDIRLQGRWLERAGFSTGARVSVQVFRKRLIIDVVQEPSQIRPRHYRGRAAP